MGGIRVPFASPWVKSLTLLKRREGTTVVGEHLCGDPFYHPVVVHELRINAGPHAQV